MTSINIIAPGGTAAWPGYERRRFRVSWGAVFAGLAVAVSVHVLLTILGVAIGASSWERGDTVESLGLGAAVWTLASMLISLFVGGVTTGRMAGLVAKKDASLHGIVLWSVFTLFMLWLVTSGLGGLVGGTFSFIERTAAAGAEQVAQGESPSDVAGRAGVPVDSLRAQAEGLRRDVIQNQEEISGAVSRGAWVTLGVLALAMIAAVVGAATGAPRAIPRDEDLHERPQPPPSEAPVTP